MIKNFIIGKQYILLDLLPAAVDLNQQIYEYAGEDPIDLNQILFKYLNTFPETFISVDPNEQDISWKAYEI